MLISISMPRYVSWQSDFDDRAHNKAFYNSVINHVKLQPVALDTGSEVLKVYKYKSYYLGLDTKRGVVFYYAKVNNRSYKKLGPHATQVEVWSDSNYSIGIAKEVFGLLLNDHNTIVSDSHQTQDGRDFWTKRVREVLTGYHGNKYKVFAWFISSNNLIRVRGLDHYLDLQKDLYGSKAKHARSLVIISDRDLHTN